MYTIGQVATMTGLSVSTLRYYDKEGLLPHLTRSSGIRQFSDRDIETLRMVECLKKTGMEIRDIKQFTLWCTQGQRHLPPAPRSATGAKRAAGGRDQPDGKGPGHAALQVLVLRKGPAGRQ